MQSKFKLLVLIGILLPAFSGCGLIRPATPWPANSTVSDTSTPLLTTEAPALPATISATDTIIPPSATEEVAPQITSLQMIDAKDGWAWTNSGQLLHTTDGGQTWIDRTPGASVGPEGSFYLNSQTAWQPVYLQSINISGLLHTTDGGQTWTELSYGPQNGLGPATVLHFTDASNGWAVEEDSAAGSIFFTLSETHDGGATWVPIPDIPPVPESNLPPGTVHLCGLCEDSFYYDPGRMIIVYGDLLTMQPGGSVRMQVSFDLGKTWQTQNLPLPKTEASALVAPSQPIFFDGEKGLLPVHLVKMNSDQTFAYQHLAFYRTQDGGASWSLLPGVLDQVAAELPAQIVLPNAEDLFVVCGKALCASHDGGQTWQAVASNLDFTQTDTRSVSMLDFLDANLGWVVIQDNDNYTLYKTVNGGRTWTQIPLHIVSSAPVITHIDTSLPTPTPIPNPTSFGTPTPDVAFDPNANAYQIRFAPEATWVEIHDTISANASKRYVLSAMQGQIMSVSIPQGTGFSLAVIGADQKSLSDPRSQLPFWRGALPSTQDYIVTVQSQVTASFTLRVVINPSGQATQKFTFTDPKYGGLLTYTDEFAPTDIVAPIDLKGTPLITLAFIDPSFYFPTTNLSEAYLVLTATQDPATVTTCTQPSANGIDTLTGQVTTQHFTFTRTEATSAAAGNLYDQISNRAVIGTECVEVIFLIHSTNIGNYPPGTVVPFDRAALLNKFEKVLDAYFAKY